MQDEFENIARGLASGRVSRRRALGRIGAGVGVGFLSLFGGDKAFAARRECPPGKQFPCGDSCCPNGSSCCIVEGKKFCCQTGKLVAGICPVDVAGAVKLGCLAV